MTQDKQVQGASFGFVLVPEINIVFGDGVGGLPCSVPLR